MTHSDQDRGDVREDVTRVLADAAGGSEDAARELVRLMYGQLRASAAALLRHESPALTLQATALVHEAYVRLAGPREIPWANRAHFYAAAAQAMRRILIDHARSKRARLAREAFAAAPEHAPPLLNLSSLARAHPDTILAVDRALSRLEDEHPNAAAMVRLRFFAGLSVDQAALTLDISPRSAARLWSLAKARLHAMLTESDPESHDG